MSNLTENICPVVPPVTPGTSSDDQVDSFRRTPLPNQRHRRRGSSVGTRDTRRCPSTVFWTKSAHSGTSSSTSTPLSRSSSSSSTTWPRNPGYGADGRETGDSEGDSRERSGVSHVPDPGGAADFSVEEGSKKTSSVVLGESRKGPSLLPPSLYL